MPVREGGPRQAHEVIKTHAVSVALDMRRGQADNDLFDRLAADGRLGLDRTALEALVAEPIEFTGAARAQVARVVDRIEVIAAQHPGAATYTPGAIL